MSLYRNSATAAGSPASATVTISHQQSQLAWVVGQISVGVAPFRAGANAIIALNGSNLTSSQAGSADAATGPPPVYLYAGDALTVTWSGVQAGDVCTATVLYTETSRAGLPSAYGGQGPTTFIPGL